MVGSNSLTAREAVGEVLADEHADVLRESVAVMVREIMELEVAQLAGAELGERAPGRRAAQRNGYRDRRWDTRVGEIELQIPKLRTGSYLPSFLDPRRRAEQGAVARYVESRVRFDRATRAGEPCRGEDLVVRNDPGRVRRRVAVAHRPSRVALQSWAGRISGARPGRRASAVLGRGRGRPVGAAVRARCCPAGSRPRGRVSAGRGACRTWCTDARDCRAARLLERPLGWGRVVATGTIARVRWSRSAPGRGGADPRWTTGDQFGSVPSARR